MNNDFYVMPKAFFLDFFGKFMTSQAGIQTIIINVLQNISKSKGNQTMKFGYFIEYNVKNVFVTAYLQWVEYQTNLLNV